MEACVGYDSGSNSIRITVDDDGPGFPEESLGKFGEKRPTRTFYEASGNRISLGLGSVIMKAIAGAHQGKVLGARIEILLPVRR